MTMRYYFILLIVLFGCNSKNHKSETSKDTVIVSEKLKPEENKKDPLQDSLILTGAIEHPDSAECFCGRDKSIIKFIFKPQNDKLNIRLCEFTNKLNKDLNIMSFYLYDCNTETVLLESEPFSAAYEIIGNDEILSIMVKGELPAENGELEFQDFCLIEFYLNDNVREMRKKLVYNAPKLDKTVRDSIIIKFDLFENDLDYRNSNIYLLDEMTFNLFVAAMNGDKEIEALYERANKSLGYDGALSEYFHQLKYFYDFIKSN